MRSPYHDPDIEDVPSSPSTSSEASCCHGLVPPYNLTEDVTTEAPVSDHSLETTAAWTDQKHSDYLNVMEEDFVRRLYGRDYCALDVCGREPYGDDPDTAESQLTEFKGWEYGRWVQRLVSESFVVPAAHSCSYALLKNPWVQHFRPCTVLYARKFMDTTSLPISRPLKDKGEADLSANVGASCPHTAAMDEKQKATLHDRQLTSSSSLGSGCTIMNSTSWSQDIEKTVAGDVSSKKRIHQCDFMEQRECMRRRTLP